MAGIQQAMILAAGKGTRLGHLTQDTPKPLIPVCGTPLLIHVLDALKAHGVKKVAINTHYLAEQVEETALLWAKKNAVEVRIYHEEVLLNTGGGICQTLSFFEDQPFFLVNGDAVWTDGPALFSQLESRFDADKMQALLSLISLEKTAAFRAPKGDFCLDTSGQVTARSVPDALWVYMCVAILTPALFAGREVQPFSLIDVYDEALKKGMLYGAAYDGKWADMGTPAGLEFAEDLLSKSLPKQSA